MNYARRSEVPMGTVRRFPRDPDARKGEKFETKQNIPLFILTSLLCLPCRSFAFLTRLRFGLVRVVGILGHVGRSCGTHFCRRLNKTQCGWKD
jgi:hypothetical protein